MSLSSDSTTETRPLHEQVIYAVANADGVAPTDLAPLYDTIDPDALDSLFESDSAGTIAFTYEGHDVVVRESVATVDGTPVDGRFGATFGFDGSSGASATGQ